MTNAELARQYFDQNREPIQALCPEIIQYWDSKDGQVTWSSRTCVRDVGDSPLTWKEKNNGHYASVRSEYFGFYLRYVKELDALEFASVRLEGKRGKTGERKLWQFKHEKPWINYSRVLIFKEDTNGYFNDGTISSGGKFYSHAVKLFISGMNSYYFDDEILNEFKKFAQNLPDSRYNSDRVFPWKYADWYQRCFIHRKASAKANVLMSYELGDVVLNPKTDSSVVALFQRLDNKYCVIRVFKYNLESYDCVSDYRCQHYTRRTGSSVTECSRVFISDKGKVSVFLNDGNEWRMKSDTGWYANRKIEFLNIDEMMTWNPIKYVFKTLDHHTIQALVNVLRHPIIEQLTKAGYPNIAKKLSRDNWIANNLKTYFMVEKEKKLPLYKLLGVNKYMLRVLESGSVPMRVIPEIKKLYNRFDISDLSEQTFNAAANMFTHNSLIDFIPSNTTYVMWAWRRDHVVTDEEREFVLRLMRLNEQNHDAAETFRDILRTYAVLIDKPDIDLTSFEGYQDLRRLHDELIRLNNIQCANREAAYNEAKRKEMEKLSKQFEKLQDERVEKFEYENDEFCIRMPKALQEITDEGLRLHHCVGGYVHSHAEGNTNIIFLRKKGEENTSFYTIEISKNNEVIQIHGNHNRWLGNNPEAVPFVYTWLEKIGAKYDKKVLLNKGAGYGASSENLGTEYLKLIA